MAGLMDKIKGMFGGKAADAGDMKDSAGDAAKDMDVDSMMQKAQDAGFDPDQLKEIMESAKGPDGKIDWKVAADKAQEAGLDVDKLKGLMPG
jgi:hypothetical protein